MVNHRTKHSKIMTALMTSDSPHTASAGLYSAFPSDG